MFPDPYYFKKMHLAFIGECEQEKRLMYKLFAVCKSVNDERQLLACRKYVELTKRQLKIPFSFTYADRAYREARDRVLV